MHADMHFMRRLVNSSRRCRSAASQHPPVPRLRGCMRRDRSDCTRLTGRQSAPIATVLEACVDACRRCGDECEKHAKHHEHHRLCAEECRRCEAACRALIDAM